MYLCIRVVYNPTYVKASTIDSAATGNPDDDQPEYTTVSRSHPPKPATTPPPLEYTTVVRQDGEKVSVKINVPAPVDQVGK